jgi:YfiH family protein
MSGPGRPPLAWALPLRDGRTARVRCTTAADGDLARHVPSDVLTGRRHEIVPRPWTWLHQVHGARVVTVDAPGDRAGEDADAAITAVTGAALAVHTADCAPVALVADEGLVGVVHAGWRGLVAGVVEEAVEAMRAAGATRVQAILGPCIHPCCYEFGATDLDRVAARYNGAAPHPVRAATQDGRPALDVPAAVAGALAASGAALVATSPTCTGCGDTPLFSHRARGDTARQAMVVWLEDEDGTS